MGRIPRGGGSGLLSPKMGVVHRFCRISTCLVVDGDELVGTVVSEGSMFIVSGTWIGSKQLGLY